MEQELSGDLQLPEPVDKNIAIVEKVAASVGIVLDIPDIDLEAEDLILEFIGQLGQQQVPSLKNKLKSLPSEPPPQPNGQRPNKHQ